MIVRVVMVGASMALTLASACASPSQDGAREPALRQSGAPRAAPVNDAVKSAEFVVDSATVDAALDLPAQLYVEHDAVVVARSPGTVDSLLAEIGDRVTAGQLLAKLESADQEIALASAEAQLENLEHVAARARTLTNVSGITVADSEQAELQLRQADIARRKARRDLELTRVLAPFDGIVSARYVRPRRYVAVGDTLFRVSEASPLYARIRVPETSAQLARAAPGDHATMIGVDGARGAAEVVHVAPIVDPASGTREAVLRVASSSRRFLPGEAVRVLLGRERRHVLRVPRAAIAPDNFALVVEDGHTTLRPVIVGGDLGGGYVEIVSGLSFGEHLARPGR